MAQFQAYAPPLIWGPWATIESHTGIRTFKLSYEAIGDTTVTGKVRYCKTIGGFVEQTFAGEIIFTTANAYASVEVCFKGVPLGSAVQGEIA